MTGEQVGESTEQTATYERTSHQFWFVVWSYGISWALWLIPIGSASAGLTVRVSALSIALPWQVLTLALGNVGPGIAAILLTYYVDDTAGVRRLLRRLVPSHRNMKWCLLAAVLPIALAEINLWVSGAPLSQGAAAIHWVRVFLMNLLLAPLWEEIGWRGYLLPSLQVKHNGLLSSVVLALVWSVWHLPLYWRAGFGFLACFAVFITGLSVLFTWFCNKTSGNLAVVVVLHAAVNASSISLLGPTMGLLGIRPFLQLTTIVCVVATGVLLVYGTNLSRYDSEGRFQEELARNTV